MARPDSAAGRAHGTLVLGIETSCDETAAAVVARGPDGGGRILSNVVRAQWEEHRRYGGVVPEIAARAHVECLDEIIAQAMREAGVTFPDLAAVAVTAGPGLIGGLLVGVATAKAIAHGARSGPRGGQSSRGACADGRPDRRAAAALSAAAHLGRAYATSDRARRRPLRASRHDHRRCAGRSLRQDGEAAGPRLSRRAGGGEGGGGRQGGPVHAAAADAGAQRGAFLLRRIEDGGAPSGAGAGAAAGRRHRRSLRRVREGGGRQRRRSRAAGDGHCRAIDCRRARGTWSWPAALRPTRRCGPR